MGKIKIFPNISQVCKGKGVHSILNSVIVKHLISLNQRWGGQTRETE